MKFRHVLLLTTAVLCSADAAALSFDDLRPDVPTCKMPPGRRPKLPAEKGPESKELLNIGYYKTLSVDLNGDGWCDFAIGVPFPINSQMEYYDIPDIILIGTSAGWRFIPAKVADRIIQERGYEDRSLIFFRVDLTNIKLVFSKHLGAPYVIGVYGGVEGTDIDALAPGCYKYNAVYRWNDAKSAFSQVKSSDADVVLKYYYTVMKPECGVALEKLRNEQRR